MAKLRVRQKTDKEINRVIRNFNQKVTRLEKLDRNVAIPEKISKKDLMSLGSRQELNRKLNQIRRFSRRGAEDLVTLESGELITEWEKRESSIENRVAQAKLTKKIKHLESTVPKIAGKKQVATFAQMGDTQYMNLVAQRERLRKRKIDDKGDLLRFRKIAQKVLRAGYGSVFRESFKTMISDIAYQHNYNDDKIEEILSKMDKLNDSSFLKLFNEDKAIKSVIYYYNTEGLELADISEDVRNLFDEIHTNIDTIIEDYE